MQSEYRSPLREEGVRENIFGQMKEEHDKEGEEPQHVEFGTIESPGRRYRARETGRRWTYDALCCARKLGECDRGARNHVSSSKAPSDKRMRRTRTGLLL